MSWLQCSLTVLMLDVLLDFLLSVTIWVLWVARAARVARAMQRLRGYRLGRCEI